LIEAAAQRLLDRLKGLEGVAILAPCGCSRTELLERLMKPGERAFSKAYAYRGFREKAGALQDVEEYASLEGLVEKLRGWSGGRVAVVPGSSWEAEALKRMLEEARLRVQLVYLPKLYEEALKELGESLDERVVELARVEHGGRSGVSLKLLRPWSGEELEELKRAKEAVLKLSPGKLGLKDYLKEAAGKAPIALATALFTAPIVLALERLLGVSGLRGLAQKLLERVGKVAADSAERLASRILEGWSKPEARNKVAEGLAELIVAAMEAEPHLGREELETVVDLVALEWGMSAGEFRELARNLAKLASGELATREDLERVKRQIEKRLSEIREELERLKREVESLKIGAQLFYADELEAGLLYSNFEVREGKPVVKSLEERGEVEVELVTAGPFKKLAEETLGRLEKGFAVLEGPKGIGKSTLAAYAVWLALLKGLADAAVRVHKLERGAASLLKNLAKYSGKRLLVLYDPSPLHAYYEPGAFAEETRKAAEAAEETLRELLKLAESGAETRALAVLPSDLYSSLSRELKSELERLTLHIDLRDVSFLEGIIRAYSGCAQSFEELAEAIAGFKGGYTLIAKYAGLALREKGCRVEDARKALEEAKGKPKLFLAYYLWSVLLKGSEDYARRVAVPLLLRAAFGPAPEGVTYLVAARGPPWRFLEPKEIEEKRFTLQDLKDEELEPIAKWLSTRHEDLMEEMLKELCGFRGEETRKPYAQYLPKLAGYQQGAGGEQGVLEWALNKVIDETREAGAIEPDEALLHFTGERLAAALKTYAPKCWRRLALIAGSALAGHEVILRAPVKLHQLLIEMPKPCEVDSYLVVDDGEIPLLTVGIMLYSPSILALPLAPWHKETAKEIKQLEENWRKKRGITYLVEHLYALGLALAIAEAVRRCENVEVWEAEVALFAAVTAVQKVLMKGYIPIILETFEPLGKLAPYYFVALTSAASANSTLDEDTVYALANAINKTLQMHEKELEERAWPLVEAIYTYSNLLTKHTIYLLKELEQIRRRMCELLRKLDGQLRVIAEALALLPALERNLEPCNNEEALSKAMKLLEELEKMEKGEPSKQAEKWARAQAFGADGFKLAVKTIRGRLAHALAQYMESNDDLEAAEKFSEYAATINKERGSWEAYLADRSRATRYSVLNAKNLEELKERAKIFENLWNEVREYERATAFYLEGEATALAEYLVSLALEGKRNELFKLLEKRGFLLKLFPDRNVSVKLLLEHLGIETGKIEAREIAIALMDDIRVDFRPAFAHLMGLPVNMLDEYREPEAEDKEVCLLAVDAVCGDEYAATLLKLEFINWLSEKVCDLLKEFAQDPKEQEAIKRYYSELLNFVGERNVGVLLQLWAPISSLASFILILWALSNDNEELARAHAKLATILNEAKLPRRLFREAAEARNEEELKLALLKLFYLHI
jgi:DNA-binding transcriptional MerR regulator